MEESNIVRKKRIQLLQPLVCCCCIEESSNRRTRKNHTKRTTIESNCQMRAKVNCNNSNGCCCCCCVNVNTNKTSIYRSQKGKKFGEQRKKRKTFTIISPKSYKQVNFSTIFYQYSLVLLLLLSNSLEFNKAIGHLAQATNAHNNINNNNNKNLILFNNDDESSSGYFRHTITNDNLKNQTPTDDLSDTYTQIPADYNGESPTTTLITPTSTTTTFATTRRPNNSDGDKKPLLRLTETELLPFADFNVQQPAFTDLIRVWPPTTISSQNYGPHSSSYDSHLKSSRRHARQQQSLQQKQRQHHHNSGQKSTADDLDDEGLSEEERMMRNHLNEDLDDTIVTADQSFDLDQLPEPPTWVNYLGDLGDYLYVQLRQHSEKTSSSSSSSNKEDSSATSETTDNDKEEDYQNQRKSANNPQQIKLETIDEILDDYYYDQYENSQVLYYGAQLVREGDILEIGCYLPSDQQAEWTKSGRPLKLSKSTSPRVVRRGDFLGAKQNFTLKIFEASLSDSGNYRCNKLSRKYHKLVVVPLKTSTAQLYMIQQRLLSIVNPQLMSQTPPSTYGLPPISRFSSPTIGGNQVQRFHSATTLNQIKQFHNQSHLKSRDTSYMLPGYLIVENQPLIVNCNITDEFILRRLRENPKFQLAWFKNGRQIMGPTPSANYQSTSSYNNVMLAKQPSSSSGSQLGRRSGNSRSVNSTPLKGDYVGPNSGFGSYRVQFLQANGRQLYITSALFSDAGEYLCSWAKLPLTRVQVSIHLN